MNGKWVTSTCENPIFKKEFELTTLQDASLSISGLGFFEAYLNGRKISEDLFVPAWSDYEPRVNRRLLYPINDSFTHRVYYLKYDVSSQLCIGNNTLEIWLGNGWYNQNVRNIEGDLWYGMPKLAFELIFNDQSNTISSIISDESLVWTPSHITSSNIYAGEEQDFRLEAAGDWQPVILTDAPRGELCLQESPPDRIIRKIKAICIQRDQDKAIYDATENTSGYAVFTLCGKSGSIVRVRYSEELAEDGSLDTSSTGNSPPQIDSFISNGTPRLCQPKFTYHGFRYFEIEGDVEDVRVYVIHADVDPKVSFHSSSEPLNLLFDAYLRSQLSNMHTGVVSDCPHRERLGYTGDGQVTADTAMLLLEGDEFYHKWIIDILDCQDINNGHVQHTAPFYGGGGGPGGWGSAIVLIPYYHYHHYRNKELLARCYPHMKKWLSYMKDHSEGNLVVREEEQGWCLGEWCTLDKVALPEPFVNTYFLIKSLEKMQEIAHILNLTDNFDSDLTSIKKAWKDAYYDPDTNSYCNGVQGADAFALDIAMGNEAMLINLVANYEQKQHFDTGIFGTDILVTVLCQYGYVDLACDLLTASGPGTFGYLQETSATTLWERWDGTESHNHHMFGAVVKHYFYSFLGIDFSKQLTIRPNIPKKLDSVSARVATRLGCVDIQFKRTSEILNFDIRSTADCTFIYRDQAYFIQKEIGYRFSFPTDL